MSTYALVLDGKKGLSALTTSFHYVRGNWWRVLGRVLALIVILLVIALVVAAIVVLIIALSGAISFASMNDFIASVVTLAEALDKSEVINLLIGIVMNFIAYCVLAPICTFYSYSIYKHLKAKKSAPEATELKTVRAWFMGLSIFGLVASAMFALFVVVTPLILATMSGFQAAKMRAEMQNQGYQNTPQVQDRGSVVNEQKQQSAPVSQSSIVFPTKAEPLINSNLSSLESKAYSDPDYKFSMNLPSGFITQDIQSGVSVIDPREKTDAVINIIARDLTEDKKTTSEIDLVKIVFGRLIDGSGITNITYKTLTIGGAKAYAAEGSVVKNGQTVNARYYVITHGNIFYIIIAASTDNPGELKALQMTVDSVSTFKAL
jgi:ABC-type multidrug transport system fused ATPase/permease subunit